MDAPSRGDYTVKRADKRQSDDGSADAREDLRAALSRFYDETYTVRLERRVGTRWEATHEIDVFHADEPVELVDGDQESKIANLIGEIFARVQEEIEAEGSSRVRATGLPRAPARRSLWGPITWLEGAMSTSEVNSEMRVLVISHLAAQQRTIEASSRHLDRAWTRCQQIADSTTANIEKMCAAFSTMIDMQSKIAGPAVGLRMAELEHQETLVRAKLEHEQGEQSMAMFMRAAELVARAVEVDRKEKRRAEKDATKTDATKTDATKTDATTVDTTATEAAPSITPSERERPRLYADAVAISQAFDDLDDDERGKVRELLTADELDRLGATMRSVSKAEFDARFGELYAQFQARGPEKLHALFQDLGGVIGIAGGATMMRLISAHERSHPEVGRG